MRIRQADGIYSPLRRLGWILPVLLGMLVLLLAGCADNGGGKKFPVVPSNEIGQFNILAESPYPDDIPVGTLPGQLLPAVAASYATGAEIFANWATALGEAADFAQSMNEPYQDLLTTQSNFQALSVACSNLSSALNTSNSASGQSAATAIASALNALAAQAQQNGFSELATRFTGAAAQATALATQIGQGLSTSDQLIAFFAADQTFRQSLQAIADEISEMTSGYYLPMQAQSRAVPTYYYVATTKYLVITKTPLSATSWVEISPGFYQRTVTWNQTTESVETTSWYYTYWDAIWNRNGFNFTQVSQTTIQSQTASSETFLSETESTSDALPPTRSYVFIESRNISKQNTTGAIGGG